MIDDFEDTTPIPPNVGAGELLKAATPGFKAGFGDSSGLEDACEKPDNE
jgi:hypothetical protein